MPITTGSKLGPYEIIAAAGAGGMGEVYRAKDTRLDRIVAIKVLPTHLNQDPALKERFEREARAVSALSHPGICVLHDVGSQDGVDFLVMEFLEGETLEKRIEKGPLAAADILRIGTEMANALEKAHRQGIVHRDLKPANIMLTKAGAKLMDFGLAKRGDPNTLASALTEMTVSQKKLTSEGAIVGTFQYMAPEQLEGAEADQRTDIFAFGEILYEMAAGQPPFKGKTKASLIASILSSEPPSIASLQPLTPPGLDRIVRICLEKDPDERFQTVHDLKLQLEWLAEGGSLAGVPAPVAHRRKHRETLAWALAAALLAVTAAAGFFLWRLTATPQPVMRATLLPPEKSNLVAIGIGGAPAVISPDGKMVVYGAMGPDGRTLLWLQRLDATTPQQLPGTEAGAYPFWSPDSRYLGFFTTNALKKIDITGGPPQTLCDANQGRGGTWSKDNVVVFGLREGPLMRVPAAGGPPVAVTQLNRSQNEGTHRWPLFLPDGKRFLYMAGPNGNDNNRNVIFVGSLDSKETRQVLGASTNVQYAEGYLLYRRENTLMAQPFDAKKADFTGDPMPLIEHIRFDGSVSRAIFSVSETGILVYQSGLANSGSRLTWFTRAGKSDGVVGDVGLFYNVALSPDGKRVATTLVEGTATATDVWMFDVARNIRTRFSFNPDREFIPVFSPDGKQVVYGDDAGTNGFLVKVRPADGSAPEQALTQTNPQNLAALDWSRDGKYLLCIGRGQGVNSGALDIWAIPMGGDRTPFVVLQDQFSKDSPQFSPDGRWFAYQSNESGRDEVYVAPFPGPGAKFQVSNNGGRLPKWSKDGKELYYISLDQKMMAVPIVLGSASVQPGAPQELFPVRVPPIRAVYVVGADRRFLINTIGEASDTVPISLFTNWASTLRK
ncbi:MAG: serine/threonine-protein kinase [Candidatus Koribacter versatilis]|uniref:non-specific serine/threonine protein kinase n=1 Tax=Candidatus Korobacter versatilis TaxID=658062 RepID=A0A932A7R6_9BACT|nr:serine/threonine-protein kinase [Candidatus Koribacter versatilis]